jgi:hypothetical protein
MSTGGNAFSNNTITVNFGSALDNKSTPVWIRVVALTATSGSYNRASSAIDDFNLTWTGTGVGVEEVTPYGNLPLTVVGFASSSAINFDFTTEEAGQYNLNIFDMTGRSVYTSSLQLAAGNQSHTVTNANLASGMYIAKISNGKTTGIAKVVVQ